MSGVWNTQPEIAGMTVGCTGKLPVFGDFVRCNASSPLARLFDDWQTEGLAQLPVKIGTGWESRFDAAQPAFFIFPEEKKNGYLTGVSIPSRDRGGRRFPFSLFAILPPVGEGPLDYLIPDAFGSFLKAARLATADDWPANFDSIYNLKLKPLQSALPRNLQYYRDRLKRYFETKTLHTFFFNLFGDFAAQEKYTLLDSLFRALIPLKKQDSGRFNFSLCIPLTPIEKSSDEDGLEIGFWILLCHKILDKSGWSPHIFWDSSHAEQGKLYLLFRSPEPRFFPNLLVPDLENNYVWDLKKAGKEKPDKSGLPDALVKILDEPDEKLERLLHINEWDRSYRA